MSVAMIDNRYRATGPQKQLSALLFMALGALIVFTSVLMLNRYVDKTDEDDNASQVNFSVQKTAQPKQQKVVKKMVKKTQPKAKNTPPPPANLSSIIGGVDMGLGFSLDGMGLGDGILGDMENVAMSQDTVDVLPQTQSRPMLEYPRRARAKGITGFVKFNLLINPRGLVEKIKILESVPAGVFDQVALNNMRGWKFDAARYQGKAVKGWFEQTIRFNLN